MKIINNHKQLIIRLFSITALFLFVTTGAFGQEWFDKIFQDGKADSKSNFFEIKSIAEEYFRNEKKEYFRRDFKPENIPELEFQNIRDYIEYKRWEEYWANHIYPDGTIVPRINEYLEFVKSVKGSSKAISAEWININRTEAPGGYWGMGRVRDIAFHPTDPDIFWLGTDQGGIWKTTDNGLTYTPVGDGLPFLRVSSICVNPVDPDIIYIMAGGTGANWSFPSIGVYRTNDGGLTWNETGMSFQLSSQKRHRRLVINPVDPSTLLLTSDDGIYRSSDEGNNWSKILSGNCWDIVFHPNGSVIIAAVGGEIYRSEDSGMSWLKVTQIGLGGRITRIAISPVESSTIAADLNVTLSSESYSIIYVSTDSGQTWTEKSRLNGNSGGGLAFSSTRYEKIYRGWTHIQSSVNMGETWTQETQWYRDNIHPEVHADFFSIKKNPLVDSTLYFCNDGGLYILDERSGEWSERSKGLIISQYYSLSGSQSDPSVLLCGSQDNGGWYRKPDGNWRTTNGGDAMHTWQHPTKPGIGYSSYPGGKIYKSTNGWYTITDISKNIDPVQEDGDWNSRYAIDPNNENIIITGCFNDVYRSVNGGSSWTRISNNLTGGKNLHCIIIPESNNNYIYASSGSSLYKSVNKGESWMTIPSPGSTTIREIIADPYNPERIWIVKSGFTEGEKVFFSGTGGQSWENITGSLPNLPALCIAYQKGTNDGLYVGMTYGIYYRNGSMDDWVYYGQGVPNTEIRDIDIQYAEGKIRCATYGRGLFESDLYPVNETRPEASFSANTRSTCTGDTIWFINESTGTGKYLWDFGDGSISNLYSPYHVYLEPGKFDVSLTVIGDQLTGNLTRESYIDIETYVPPVMLGESDREMGSGLYLDDDSYGMIFNVHFPAILQSVKVYTFLKGTRQFEVYDKSGALVSKVSRNLESGENRVPLGFKLQNGTDYVLKVSGLSYLYYNSDGAGYPYGKYEPVSITGNTAFEKEKYFYFYDWEVRYQTCSLESLPAVGESENVADDRIIISPNPVKDQFTITLMGFDQEEMVNVRIFTLEGIQVYNINLNLDREVTLPVTVLPGTAGMYIIEAFSNGKSYTKTMIAVK